MSNIERTLCVQDRKLLFIACASLHLAACGGSGESELDRSDSGVVGFAVDLKQELAPLIVEAL
jgi:hypothetical protein